MAASSITLDSSNRAQLAQWLDQGDWIVACLCAAWCDTCCSYRSGFDQLAAQHPDKRFVWIDIEDQADFIGDLDVESFPTLLLQREDHVAFFGTVLPDVKLADRLIRAQAEKTDDMLNVVRDEAAANQQICNLRIRLQEA